MLNIVEVGFGSGVVVEALIQDWLLGLRESHAILVIRCLKLPNMDMGVARTSNRNLSRTGTLFGVSRVHYQLISIEKNLLNLIVQIYPHIKLN